MRNDVIVASGCKVARLKGTIYLYHVIMLVPYLPLLGTRAIFDPKFLTLVHK
jgi:hypothetical protein